MSNAPNNEAACEDEKKYSRLVDEVITSELPASKWERLRKHLQGCARCRARYNKAVLAERMLNGGPKAPDFMTRPSPAELDRIARAVVPGGDANAWQRLLQWFAAPTQRWVATGMVAAAAALLLIPVLRHGTKAPAPETFQPRGGKGPVELFSKNLNGKTVERSAGLRAFCLIKDQVQALDPKGAAAPRCDRSAQLKLAVSNPGGFKNLFLVGMDGEHDLKWYAPRPPETHSVAAPLETQGIDVPVGASVRLAVNHRPGPVRIFALFSDSPVTAAEVEAATEDLARRHVDAKTAEALPLKRQDVLQRSLLIDVEP
ncbi:MAG TPA: hypothetical protein VFF06_22550 [Polyangia bacterium]|nr:hypothetical protein [Polyangia bacterium]